MLNRSHIIIAMLLLAAACGGETSNLPTRPTVTPSTSPSPTPPPSQSAPAAHLVISDFAIVVMAGHSAEARFTLTETGGVSGATIQRVTVFTPQESDIADVGSCWPATIRVEAGGTLDLFNARWESLSYCAPYFDGTVSDSVSLTVTFVDDRGVTGTTTATTSTIRYP